MAAMTDTRTDAAQIAELDREARDLRRLLRDTGHDVSLHDCVRIVLAGRVAAASYCVAGLNWRCLDREPGEVYRELLDIVDADEAAR